MSSKYDKSIQISREEEGSYHRREVESTPGRSGKSYTTESYEVVPVSRSSSGGAKQLAHHQHNKDYTSDEDNYEEWTTSKRKVNHKTRQVETRVSRQLLVEDGKVIADSGPQVTTRIKEDNKVEECEKEKAPKNRGRFEALEGAPEGESSGRVLGQKKEIQRVTREVREENMQYHDERFKELTGPEVHRSAIRAPHELITINDQKSSSSSSAPRGKMVHYSQKGKKTRDTDEILEVAKLAIDGSITKEVKRTKQHEECSEDEKPDETGEAEALKRKPIVTKSSRRGADYVNDFDDTSNCPSDDEQQQQRHTGKTSRQHSSSRHSHQHQAEDDAFPRYQLDPLLDSLRDDEFVVRDEPNAQRHRLERKQRMDSSDDEANDHKYQRQQYSKHQPLVEPSRTVEIPEEYRAHRRQLKGQTIASHQREPVERSLSPSHKTSSRTQHRPSPYGGGHREDASVQAHLSSDEDDVHERQAHQLQRQSTGGSRRNYYYGDQRRAKSPASSVSSSDLSDPKEQMKRGKSYTTSGRDSGFKSPHSHRQVHTPISRDDDEQHQIYSVSSKASKGRDRLGAVSPTPSAGQRSVKTSVTTVSAGLEEPKAPRRPTRAGAKSKERESNIKQEKAFYLTQSHFNNMPPSVRGSNTSEYRRRRNINTSNHYQYDYDPATASANINGGTKSGGRERRPSASSLASCTTIKVPYRRHAEEAQFEGAVRPVKEMVDSELSLEKDIRQLKKRLASMESGQQQPSYNYNTIISQVQPAPQVVGAYNVQVIEQQSPFESTSEVSSSIARLEDLSNELSSSLQLAATTNNNVTSNNNNNEPNFNLDDYIKHKAVPARVDSTGDSLVAADDMDDSSVVSSSCSLRSFRTYHIRSDELQSPKHLAEHYKMKDEDLDDERHFPVVNQQEKQQLNLEELEKDKSKPAAWIFDPRDGSSKAIVAPPKPEKPAPAKVDPKELAESRGGQSYYLEVHDNNAAPATAYGDATTADATFIAKPNQVARRSPRPSSIDSLYSRWNSQGTLVPRKDERKPQRQQMAASSRSTSRPNLASGGHHATTNLPLNGQRRQLPFMGSQLSNRSKSSSCLVSSTRPSKYSIYGGLRQANGNSQKPVPRLSYSRAIGPKSQRPLGDQQQQIKTPSRYLKMK